MKIVIQKYAWVLYCLFVLAVTCFIWRNSIMDAAASSQSSNVIVDMIAPADPNKVDFWSKWIRKAAHIVEYAMLGVAVSCLVHYVKSHYHRISYGWAFFYVLAVAVTDEHIQSFSDRSSSTNDIVLDFIGAVLGFVLVLLAIQVYFKVKKLRNFKQKGELERGRE